MKRLCLFAIVLAMISCQKEDMTFTQTPLDFIKIVSIEHNRDNDDFEEGWNTSFHYDQQDYLLRTYKDYTTPKHKIYKYDSVMQLLEILEYRSNEDLLLFRDSLVYNPNGSLIKKYYFSRNGGDDLPLSMIDSLVYDNFRQIQSRYVFWMPENTLRRIHKFYWENGNVVKTEEYSSEEDLDHEITFQYDDKKNYKKSNPAFLMTYEYWSENNIIDSELTDYTGLIDIYCNQTNPIQKYYSSGYPKKMRNKCGYTEEIRYE